MRRAHDIVTRALAVLLAASCSSAALACGESLGTQVQQVRNERYSIAYRTAPSPVPVGRHFAVDFVVCPAAGAAPAQEVRVDANMPAHKHGMNYRATVVRARDGTYRADGLLFHMPGRWELTFDVVQGNGTQRLASSLDVR